MDPTYLLALAMFAGSASGILATDQRRKDRARRTSLAIFQREELYKGFIQEASGSTPMHPSTTRSRIRGDRTTNVSFDLAVNGRQ